MKTIFRLLVLVLMLVGWSLAALSLHVVRAAGPDGETIALIPKNSINPAYILDTYVDTRNWTLDDVKNHRRVVERLIQVGKADLLAHVVADARGIDVEHELRDAIDSETEPATTRQTTRPATSVHARAAKQLAKDAAFWTDLFK